VVDFHNLGNLVEVAPHSRANLPSSITGSMAVWVESMAQGTAAYCLHNLSNNHNFPTIEYLNDNWYYLHWCNKKYYTKPCL